VSNTLDPTAQLSYAFGGPCATGLFKQQPEDFRVDEIAGFDPEGEGDHVFLKIEKTSLTTNSVANLLRQFCDLQHRDVGYAGMKDKHAVTTQWFSLNMAGKPEPDWGTIENEQLRILRFGRHRRKLKRGVLKGNRFSIVIRDLQADRQLLEDRLQQIKKQGVPNYFGSQRFGYQGGNIDQARLMFEHQLKNLKRDERSILLSSVRSMLFNAVLDERVRLDNWYQLLDGEVINLDSTERHFVEPIDDTLIARASEMDVHPTGPLCGLPSRALQPSGLAGDIEKQVLGQYGYWQRGLEAFRLEHARRPLRVAVREMDWSLEKAQLSLSFSLTSGAYATVVLREILTDPGD
jgi:tRNA pseudouridine13 synthase